MPGTRATTCPASRTIRCCSHVVADCAAGIYHAANASPASQGLQLSLRPSVLTGIMARAPATASQSKTSGSSVAPRRWRSVNTRGKPTGRPTGPTYSPTYRLVAPRAAVVDEANVGTIGSSGADGGLERGSGRQRLPRLARRLASAAAAAATGAARSAGATGTTPSPCTATAAAAAIRGVGSAVAGTASAPARRV